MSDIHIRKEGRAGRITLNRPKALNAVTWDMLRALDAALSDWEQDDTVALVLIDAAGERAFAAGGDIVDLYKTGKAGDFSFGRSFWAEEYRLNARIAAYPKPYIAFMQGFVMGGGVGISCHGSHRIVCETTQIAMPECGIGLIPDVGGSLLLAEAPGHLGEFLGLTGARMGPGDAIHTGFADIHVPEARWESLKSDLIATGDPDAIPPLASDVPGPGPIAAMQDDIAALFARDSLAEIATACAQTASDSAAMAHKLIAKNAPLSMACALETIRAARGTTLTDALAREFRYVWRCMEHGDFLEGIRAQVIDKDRKPVWRHDRIAAVTPDDVDAMLAPLGDDELTFET